MRLDYIYIYPSTHRIMCVCVSEEVTPFTQELARANMSSIVVFVVLYAISCYIVPIIWRYLICICIYTRKHTDSRHIHRLSACCFMPRCWTGHNNRSPNQKPFHPKIRHISLYTPVSTAIFIGQGQHIPRNVLRVLASAKRKSRTRWATWQILCRDT